MVQIYESGIEVVATVALQSLNGDVITDPDSASYRVLDSSEAEVIANTVITLAGGEANLVATIPSVSNTLDATKYRGYRIVEFTFIKDTSTYVQKFEYVLQGLTSLIVGTNSFQTYAQAIITSMDLADVDHFKNEISTTQNSALTDAYQSISSMSYVVNGVIKPPLTRLTSAEIELLDTRFLNALRRSQVVEANETLNPESIHKKRVAGLLAESIGESSVMFRPEKVMNNQPLTRRSMVMLSEWMNWTLPIGRA